MLIDLELDHLKESKRLRCNLVAFLKVFRDINKLYFCEKYRNWGRLDLKRHEDNFGNQYDQVLMRKQHFS